MRSTIKVLVVDDSALIRQMLTRALSVDPSIEIVGSAKTGLEAIEKAHALQPDVVTLDIEMPELTGLEALPHIVKSSTARIVMLSALGDADTTYQALSEGATDFLVKPSGGVARSLNELTEELLKKIKIAYRVSPGLRCLGRPEERRTAGGNGRGMRRQDLPVDKLVAIAASTGGPPALEKVFSGLTAELPAAYVVVQHLPAGFTSSLARRLARVTDISVLEAEEGMPIEQGTAYLAPHGHHLGISGMRTKRIVLDESAPVHGVRPAADPLLASAASNYRERCVGVILTGMGSDGTDGLRHIQEAGGQTIVQDEESSVVWGMPGAAMRAGVAGHVVPLPAISAEIRRAVRG
ncbi:MAG: protein-glutamate methylesterase/protein-glutamine glutaminase [Coriobacteriia bacterium]